MAVYRCNSCLGVYRELLPDGMLYFHACPPIVDPSTGEVRDREDPRDENIDRFTGQIKARGRGREKVEEG